MEQLSLPTFSLCASLVNELHRECGSTAIHTHTKPPNTRRQRHHAHREDAQSSTDTHEASSSNKAQQQGQRDIDTQILLPPSTHAHAQAPLSPGTHSVTLQVSEQQDVHSSSVQEGGYTTVLPRHVLAALIRELQQGCPPLSCCDLPGGLCRLSWPAHQDARLATSIHSLLAAWYPRLNRHNHSLLGPMHLQCASNAAWASLEAQEAAARTGRAKELVELVRHVVGRQRPQSHTSTQSQGGRSAQGQSRGAAGLPWLVQLRWVSSLSAQPPRTDLKQQQRSDLPKDQQQAQQQGRQQLQQQQTQPRQEEWVGCEVVLTDGQGVFLVVVVRLVRLLKPPRSKKRAQAFAKQEGTRCFERRRAIRAAIAAALSFQEQHAGCVVHAFAGTCLSHAEGLDVVAPAGGAAAKEQQLMLAHAMMPGLCTGPMLEAHHSTGAAHNTDTLFPFQRQPASLLSSMLVGEQWGDGKQVSLHSRHGRPTRSSWNPRKPMCHPKREKRASAGAGRQHVLRLEGAESRDEGWGGSASAWLGAGVVVCGVVGVALVFYSRQRRSA